MVAGYHLIWTAYGSWLANDPRGSTSVEIRVEKLAPLGDLHYGRKPVQPRPARLREFYDQARDLLKHPLLTFNDEDIELIAAAFRNAINENRYTCYACVIMPDHVHALIRKHRDRAETMMDNLRQSSREKLIQAGRRAPTHPVWAGGRGWIGFLNTPADFVRTIAYIRQNRIKIGKSIQEWDFVKAYDGWLPGQYRG